MGRYLKTTTRPRGMDYIDAVADPEAEAIGTGLGAPKERTAQ